MYGDDAELEVGANNIRRNRNGETEDELRGQIQNVYQQELGRDADEGGLQGFLDYALTGNDVRVDRDVRAKIRNSDEYRNRQTTTATPATAQPGAPPATTATQTTVPAPSPAMTTRLTGTEGANGSTAQRAVGYASNPALDRMVEEMIANNRMNSERMARLDEEKASQNRQTRTNIMDRYNKVSGDVTMQDPILQRAAQVHNAAGQREVARGREAMAARGAAQHMSTGASDANLEGMYENLGRDQSEFESNLLIGENDKRRNEIDDLLHLGAGILSSDEDRMLRDRSTTIGAANDSLGLKSGSYLRGAAQDDNFYTQNRGMDLNNQHFYDDVGYNAALQEALMNQMMYRSLAGAD